MARTPFATEIHNTSQKSARVPAQNPTYIVIHHAATISFETVVNMENSGSRQVSSTLVVKDDRVASMFDEAYRAWSLGSQEWDSKSLSVETCNSGGADQGWPISDSSYMTLAKIIADWCSRYGIPCDRDHIIGHNEVYTRFGASYATACPGGINLDYLVSLALKILSPKKGHPGMYFTRNLDTSNVELHTDNGSVVIQNPDHLALLTRMIDSYPRWDNFYNAQVEIIKGYIQAASTADDAETKKIVAELQKIKVPELSDADLAKIGAGVKLSLSDADLSKIAALDDAEFKAVLAKPGTTPAEFVAALKNAL